MASNTERPRSSSARPSRHDPPTKSLKGMLALAPERNLPDRFPAVLTPSQSENGLPGGIFVESNEITQRHGKVIILGCAERIDSHRLLEPCNNDREAQRVESRIQK